MSEIKKHNLHKQAWCFMQTGYELRITNDILMCDNQQLRCQNYTKCSVYLLSAHITWCHKAVNTLNGGLETYKFLSASNHIFLPNNNVSEQVCA